MEVYADIMFFINFFMDFFIFWIVSRLVKTKVSVLNLIIGSTLGAVLYMVIIFVPYLNIFYNFFGSLIILFICLGIIFKPKKIKDMLKLLFFAHASSFAVGGMAMAMFYFTNFSHIIGNNIIFTIGNFSVKLLVASTCMIYIFIKLGTGFINTNILNRENFCTLKIYMNGHKAQLTALIDTGNYLKDPIDKSSIIIAEFVHISDFFPPEIRISFYKEENIDVIKIFEVLKQNGAIKKIRMIPFKSLGNNNGMLIGFKPDKIEVLYGKKELIFLDDVIIGVYNGELCPKNGYSAIVSPEILNELEI